ncbi:MAG: DUF2953 domain-containing protein [Oscillospiraceae bacterium]|nr:DUF2953 domain-containing protein [Oscillospiraceae bacterium]
MNGLYAVLIVGCILFLVGCIRIGAQVEYCEEGLFVRVRVGRFLVPVFPVKKKKDTHSKVKKAEKKASPAQKKKGGLLQLALDFIPLVLDTVKRFRRKLKVDKLDMELVVCAPDPADTAVRYGQANALLGTLWQPITQAFHVKDGHAHVGVNFEEGKTTLYLLASMSLTIAQTLGLALAFGVKALGILVRAKRKQTKHIQQGEAV